MKTPELKPCPFCGGEGDFHYVCGEYFVMCNDCHSASEAWTDKEKATWSWNRRNQMHKPITHEELFENIYSVVWFEELDGKILNALLSPLRLMNVGHAYAEFEQFGTSNWVNARVDDYGYTWRCWTKEPTTREMEDAEWLK